MKSSNCTAESHRKYSQETTDLREERERARATESDRERRDRAIELGSRDFNGERGGRTAGTSSGRFSSAFVSSGRRTREPLVLSQRGRTTGQRTADIPNNNVGQEPILAGKNRPFLEVWTCTRLVINWVYTTYPSVNALPTSLSWGLQQCWAGNPLWWVRTNVERFLELGTHSHRISTWVCISYPLVLKISNELVFVYNRGMNCFWGQIL
jgi:hypothetical protein